MSALIDGRLGALPDNIKSSLTNISSQYQPANAMILNTTQKLNLITKSVSSNRSLNENYNNYISSFKLDVENLMDLINFYQKLVWLFSILTALFVTLLMAINISESRKTIIIEKIQKEIMNKEITKILEDLNLILQGDLNHRVQNKPGQLLTLSDFINSVLDKISEEFEKQLNIVGSLKVNYKNYESENEGITGSLSIQDDNLNNVMDYMKLLSNSFTDVKKAIITTNKLIDMLMQGSQRNAINRWSMANDLPYYIIFWAINRGVVELWDGRAILKSSRGLDQKGLLQTEIVSNSTAHMSVDHDALVRMLSDTFKVSAKLCFKRLILNRKKWGVE